MYIKNTTNQILTLHTIKQKSNYFEVNTKLHSASYFAEPYSDTKV